MIEKIAIGVVCDRCGASCSEVKGESFFMGDPFELHRCIDNPYHYNTVKIETFDSRKPYTDKMSFDLCGKCLNELGEWLKRSDNNG